MPHLGSSPAAEPKRPHPTPPRPERLFCHTGAGPIHGRAIANSSGLPLVLLHHSPGSSGNHLELMLGYRQPRPVYAFDLPGHGDRGRFDGTARSEHGAEAMVAALDGWGTGDAERVGEGRGAAVAVAMKKPAGRRFAKTTLATPPIAGASPPPSFAPQPFGE